MDLFVVPTIGFDLLYAFVIVRLDRRDLVWMDVTATPTAEWVARQITEAFPWFGLATFLAEHRLDDLCRLRLAEPELAQKFGPLIVRARHDAFSRGPSETISEIQRAVWPSRA